MKHYYKVTVVRGHVGSAHDDATITFYEVAENMIKAIDKARLHGGVKHSRIPVNAKEITSQEFYAHGKINAYDVALCRN